MDKLLLQAFQNLKDTEVSKGVHAGLVHMVTFERYKRYAFVVTVLIAINFIFSLSRLYTKLMEINAIEVINAIFSTLELSFNSVTDSFSIIFQFLPMQSVLLLFCNLLALILMVSLLQLLSKIRDRVLI
jgi:hypothetical protein